MIRTNVFLSAIVVFSWLPAAHAGDATCVSGDSFIAWGDALDGLQLGIAPPIGTNGVAEPLFDGESLRAVVYCRNVGSTPVRLLASVHTCLLGQGGGNALLASGLTLSPKEGGASVNVTYQGWNHLALLDTRRKKGDQPQETLNGSFGGKTDIRLSEADANRMTTVLEPGATGQVVRVDFTPEKKPRSWWWPEDESARLAPGSYQVAAFLNVDQEQSPWKGVVKSGALEVRIPAKGTTGGEAGGGAPGGSE